MGSRAILFLSRRIIFSACDRLRGSHWKPPGCPCSSDILNLVGVDRLSGLTSTSTPAALVQLINQERRIAHDLQKDRSGY